MQHYKALVTAAVCLLWLGCRFDSVEPQYSEYEPILASRSVLDRIEFTAATPVITTGKIYSYGNYILINEIDKGYHIIDNTDPSKPTDVGFLSILGSREVAVYNKVLYSDNATDLIAVDISDITHPRILSRTENIFPIQEPPDDLPPHPDYSPGQRPANTVIIEWRKRQ